MSIIAGQLRQLITTVLNDMSFQCKKKLDSSDAINLLMLTAAQETYCGNYIYQLNGPAKGIFQIEPTTANDIFENYLKNRKVLLSCVNSWRTSKDLLLDLTGNLLFQIALSRMIYYRVASKIPSSLDELAKYYKKYWNTESGKATVESAIQNYKRFALSKKEKM